MKVIVTGANSAVGLAILRRTPKMGAASDTFVAAVRSQRAEEQIRVHLGSLDDVARISYEDTASLDIAFQGASAGIHLAGILFESPDSTYEQANVASTRAVVEAARRAGMQKFVLISAIGADEASSNRYYRTKGEAEAIVRASGLNYTVLRIPLLLGPGTAGAAALRRNVNKNTVKLIGGGRNFQQPLYVEDAAQAAIAAATHSSVAKNDTLQLVGPVSLPERELVERAASMLKRNVRIGSIPKSFLSWMLAIRKPRSGFSRDTLEVITANTRLNAEPAARALGIQLTGIDEMIQHSLDQGPRNE